jgi:hypothetical protein
LSPFSSQTVTALTEVITGGSANTVRPVIGIYRSGTDLVNFFRHLGHTITIGSRVPSVRQLLDELHAQPDGEATLTRVIEQAADPRDFLDHPDRHTAVVEYLNRRLALDGFELRTVGGRAKLVRVNADAVAVSDLRARIEAHDLDSVRLDFERALAEGDPEDAITAACSMVESVCKCLLDLMGKPYPADKSISPLAKEVSRHLNLSPERDVTADIKQILGGLASVAGGIGALRTHAGDAHGRGQGAPRVDARVARLAVHAASTLALFLIETWQLERPESRLLTPSVLAHGERRENGSALAVTSRPV